MIFMPFGVWEGSLRIGSAIVSIVLAIASVAPARADCIAQAIGDVNCDCSVDAEDLPLFVAALTDQVPPTPCGLYLADANGDGTVDGADISGFMAALLDPAAIRMVRTWADLEYAAANYDPGDTIRLDAASFDGSHAATVLTFERGDITIDWNTGNMALVQHFGDDGRIDIDVGSTGLFFRATVDMTVTSDAPIRFMRTGNASDYHILHFNAAFNSLAAHISTWDVVGNEQFAVETWACWRFDSTFSHLEATLTDCSATRATGDGFSTGGFNSCVVTFNNCTSFDNQDEAASPHDDSTINITGGNYSSASALGNVIAFGKGFSPYIHPTANINGATLSGSSCIAVLGVGPYGVANVTETTLSIDTDGRLVQFRSNSSISIDHSDLSIGNGCRMWGEDEAATGASFVCTDSSIGVPSLAAGNSDAIFMDRLVDSVAIARCDWNMSGSTIAGRLTNPRIGQTWTIIDCRMTGGDFPGPTVFTGPTINAGAGALRFRRNYCDLSEWVTHDAVHYRGYVGASDNAAVVNVDGNVFANLPNQLVGDRRRTVVSILNASPQSTVTHNTIWNNNDEASPTSYGIYFVPSLECRGNIVTGNWLCGIREDGPSAYAGTYNWSIVSGSQFIGDGAPSATDTAGGPAPIFADANSGARAGFALATTMNSVPFPAFQQQRVSTVIGVSPANAAAIARSPDLIADAGNQFAPDAEPIPIGQIGIDPGAIVSDAAMLQVEVVDIAMGMQFIQWSDGDVNNPRTIQRNADLELTAIVGE